MSETPSQQPPTVQAVSTNKDERLWAMLCHLTGLAFFIPLGNVIAPLIIWLLKKEEYPLVNDQGKESLNFQITVFIGFLICGILTLVVIGPFLALVLFVIDVIFVIKGTLRANAGEAYRYPWALRLIK